MTPNQIRTLSTNQLINAIEFLRRDTPISDVKMTPL